MRDLFHILDITIHVPESDIAHISDDILNEFTDYFSEDYQSCVKDTVKLNILPGNDPVFCRARTIPIKLRDKVKAELQRLVDSGKLVKVFSSDYASPIVVALKKNVNNRICGYLSVSVNKHLDPVHSSLPTIDEVIARVGNAKISIDLVRAFLQLPLHESSKPFTTINTPEGLFTYNYLPFSLKDSPGIFQAFITKVLNGIDEIVVYQDGILVMCSHISTLRKVLSALMNAGIKINAGKYTFFTEEVKYLGYIFSQFDVRTDSGKIRAIIDAPAPTNVKQLQSFIGMCNYYSRFIHNFASYISPLYSLLQKNAQFH